MELVHKGEFKKFATGTHKVEIYKVGDKYTLFVDDYFRVTTNSRNGQEAIQSLVDFIDRKYADKNVLTHSHISHFLKRNNGYETIIKSIIDEYLKLNEPQMSITQKAIVKMAIAYGCTKFIEKVKI